MKHAKTLMIWLAGFLPASAVTVVNGSFENLDSSYVNATGFDQMNMNVAPGWTPVDTPDWFWGEGPANLWNTPYGDYFTLGAANEIYREGVFQTITGLTIGLEYVVGFSQANGLYYTGAYEGADFVGGWEVLVDGLSLDLFDSANSNSVPAPDHTSDWLDRTVSFVATAEEMELKFLAYKNPQIMAQGATFQFLDSVTVSPVPEPSAVFLLVLGTLGLATRRQRHV